MTLKQHQKLVKMIETYTKKIDTCKNDTDEVLFIDTIEYLIDLQTRQAKELEL